MKTPLIGTTESSVQRCFFDMIWPALFPESRLKNQQMANYRAHIRYRSHEGISGTSLNKRDEFNRMIADCMAGKIEIKTGAVK